MINKQKIKNLMTIIRFDVLSRMPNRIGMDNLEIIDLESGAKAINSILKNTNKEYVAFTDPDATYDKDYFKKVLLSFALSPEISCARGLVKSHEGTALTICKKLKNKCKIFSAKSDYTNIMMIPDGAVFRTDIIRKNNILFNESLSYSGGVAFVVKYHEASNAWVQLNSPVYVTGQILDETSPNTPQSNNRDWYIEPTQPMLDELGGADRQLSRIAQYAMLYLTIARFRSNQSSKVKMAFEDPADLDSYLSEVKKVVQKTDDEVLFCRKNTVRRKANNSLYLAGFKDPDIRSRIKTKACGNDAVLLLDGDSGKEICKLSELEFTVITVHMIKENGRPGLKLSLRNPEILPSDDYNIVFTNVNNGETYIAEKTQQIAGLTFFFNLEAARTTTLEVFLPFDEKEDVQSFEMHIEIGSSKYARRIIFDDNWQNKINSEIESSYWYKNGYVIGNADGLITVRKTDESELPRYEHAYTEDIRKLLDAAKSKESINDFEKVLRWRKLYHETADQYKDKRIWAYYDKGYKAGDNAEYAIRYASRQDDGIEKLFYIYPGCDDCERMKAEGYNVMRPSSDEAAMNAMHAEVIYMTHVPPYRKLGVPDRILKYLKDLLDAKVIRLYHGFPIIEHYSYSQVADDASAVAVGSTYEKNLYTSAIHGYSETQVIESGMPRYDDLINENSKQILIAPTWRPFLVGGIKPGSGETLYNPGFKESIFFKHYDAIIKNPKLLQTARENGYKIVVFMHPKLSAQTCDFEENDVVNSLSCTKDIDYVSVMKKSSLMVTDYSSVQYDFAYMRKPVVYFHAPELPYWRRTNFDYEGIGFGEICKTIDELVDVLCDYMSTGCVLKDKYDKRVEEFFIHDDQESGRRLYEGTLKMLEKLQD